MRPKKIKRKNIKLKQKPINLINLRYTRTYRMINENITIKSFKNIGKSTN
jgi:hypothetical protein